MNKAVLLDELMQLAYDERLEIAERLWDSVHPPGSAWPGEPFVLSAEQKIEIDRRLAEHERDPSTAEPWEEVRARLWSRLK